jgi:membrane protein required for colicin V production
MEAGTWIDILIVGVIGLSVLTGLMRGFFKELIALGAWVLAIWLGVTYTNTFSANLIPYITDSTVRAGVSFIIIVLVCLLFGMIVNALLGFLLKHSGLSGADRILGMGFGFLRGVLIVSLAMVVAGMTGMNLQPYRSTSTLYVYFTPIVSKIATYIQPYIAKAVESGKGVEMKTIKK